jgi:hypothetical protein
VAIAACMNITVAVVMAVILMTRFSVALTFSTPCRARLPMPRTIYITYSGSKSRLKSNKQVIIQGYFQEPRWLTSNLSAVDVAGPLSGTCDGVVAAGGGSPGHICNGREGNAVACIESSCVGGNRQL